MKKYYIVIEGAQKGPFSIDELKKLKITGSTLIWTEELENWVAAKNIEALKEIIKKSPPPIPNQTSILRVKAEVINKNEKLISPSTEVAIAKESINIFQYIIAGGVIGVLTYLISFYGLYEGNKFDNYNFDGIRVEMPYMTGAPNPNDFPFSVSWTEVSTIRYDIERRKDFYSQKSLSNAFIAFLVATGGLILIRVTSKGTKWVQKTAQKEV